jgi:hypothetical protein
MGMAAMDLAAAMPVEYLNSDRTVREEPMEARSRRSWAAMEGSRLGPTPRWPDRGPGQSRGLKR